MKYKCEECHDTGWYGDNGPGIKGNREYQRCECGAVTKFAVCPTCKGRGIIPDNAVDYIAHSNDKHLSVKVPIQSIKDALWWVEDGLNNADFPSHTDWKRTEKCRAELKAYLDKIYNPKIQAMPKTHG